MAERGWSRSAGLSAPAAFKAVPVPDRFTLDGSLPASFNSGPRIISDAINREVCAASTSVVSEMAESRGLDPQALRPVPLSRRSRSLTGLLSKGNGGWWTESNLKPLRTGATIRRRFHPALLAPPIDPRTVQGVFTNWRSAEVSIPKPYGPKRFPVVPSTQPVHAPIWCQREVLTLRPPRYERGALPLSYAGTLKV